MQWSKSLRLCWFFPEYNTIGSYIRSDTSVVLRLKQPHLLLPPGHYVPLIFFWAIGTQSLPISSSFDFHLEPHFWTQPILYSCGCKIYLSSEIVLFCCHLRCLSWVPSCLLLISIFSCLVRQASRLSTVTLVQLELHLCLAVMLSAAMGHLNQDCRPYFSCLTITSTCITSCCYCKVHQVSYSFEMP